MARIAKTEEGLPAEHRNSVASGASLGPAPHSPEPQDRRGDEEALPEIRDKRFPNEDTPTVPDATGYSDPGEPISGE
jgi:hypothetical protein